MQVFNEGFTVDYYPDGRPKDYYSDVVIYKGGEEAARGRIRVNEPMDFEGFRFHQNSFGPTIGLDIQSEAGQTLYSETMVLGQVFGNVPFEMVSIPTTEINAVVALAEGNTTSNVVGGTFIRGGQEPRVAVMAFEGDMGSQPLFVARMAPGETYTGNGLRITFRGTQFFTGVVARNDPGAVYIWIAAGLFVPALWVTFWFARRRIWAQYRDGRVALAGMADRFVDLQKEIDEIVGAVGGGPTNEPKEAPDAGVREPSPAAVP
jgi:cytochrome c biogenesis protein